MGVGSCQESIWSEATQKRAELKEKEQAGVKIAGCWIQLCLKATNLKAEIKR